MPDLILGILVALGALALSIAAHEIAHLVVARLVGHQVFELQIGAGPVLARRVGSVDVAVGPLLFGGHVLTGAPHMDGFRWRSAAVAGAGMVANAGLFAVGVAAESPPLALCNMAALLANGWPGRRAALGRDSSDGRHLLDLALGRHLDEARSAWYCIRAQRARERGDLDEADRALADGRSGVGRTDALRAIEGLVAFERRDLAGVVDAYAPLVDGARVTVAARAGFAADAAWAASLSDDPELRGLAEPLAAFAHAADRTARRRTILALALVDAGQPERALELLRGLDDVHAEGVRAIALGALGALDAAREVVARAVVPAMAEDHPLRARAERAVGAT